MASLPPEPAAKCSERYRTLLDEPERDAVDVAAALAGAGEEVPPGSAAMLVIAVERLEHALAHAMDAELVCDVDD